MSTFWRASNHIHAGLLTRLGGSAHLHDRRKVNGLHELFEVRFLGRGHAGIGISQHVVQNPRRLLVGNVLLGSLLGGWRGPAFFVPVFFFALLLRCNFSRLHQARPGCGFHGCRLRRGRRCNFGGLFYSGLLGRPRGAFAELAFRGEFATVRNDELRLFFSHIFCPIQVRILLLNLDCNARMRASSWS